MITGIQDDKGFGLVQALSTWGDLIPSKIIKGDKIEEGDVLIGISSSGIHSNGLTLARKALEVKDNIHRYYKELGRTLGEELLRDQHISTLRK